MGRRWTGPTLVPVVLLLFAACTGGDGGTSGDNGTGTGDTVAAADVRGLRLGDGATMLHDLGLCVLVEQGSGAERRPIIVAQQPPPGSEVQMGALVIVVIDTPEDVSSVMEQIGAANEALDCNRGSGIGGVGGTAGLDGTGS